MTVITVSFHLKLFNLLDLKNNKTSHFNKSLLKAGLSNDNTKFAKGFEKVYNELFDLNDERKSYKSSFTNMNNIKSNDYSNNSKINKFKLDYMTNNNDTSKYNTNLNKRAINYFDQKHKLSEMNRNLNKRSKSPLTNKASDNLKPCNLNVFDLYFFS